MNELERIANEARRLRQLADASRFLIEATPDSSRLLELIVRSAADVLGTAAALFLQVGGGAPELKALFHPEPAKLVEIRTRLPQRIPSTQSETFDALAHAFGTPHVLLLPLRADEDLGALVLARDASHGTFDDEEVTFARELAEVAARCLVNARALEGSRQQVAGLREEVRQRLVEVEGANRTKSAFLATMSHEIRTPMNAIINMTELAMETETVSKQQHCLSVVRDAANGLLALVNDILDFSKIEAEKVALETAPFRLRSLLEDVTNTFRGRVMEKGIEFVVMCAPDVPELVVGDALRLRQVLINLTSNAFKFTHQGEVVLRISPAAATGEYDQIRFEVRDTGVGIPEDKQAGIFEPFTQADTSSTRKYGGTGLGLALCYRLVALMGGRLEFQSVPGQGTQLSFVAKFGHSEEQPAPLRVEPAVLTRLRVLVVEDNATTRELLLTLLAGFQVQAEAVPTAEAGLERVVAMRNAGWPFDVVLVDWILPGMDGLELVRRVRALPGGQEPRLVAMSAFGGRNEEARFRESGVSDFLQKPITRSTLLDTLMSLLGHQRQRQAPKAPINERALAGYRVLVAEDNEANQLVIEELLTRAGVAIEFAPDGVIAVEKCASRVFDAVLMDMQMPRLDGLEATRRIRQLPVGADVPIIALTANAIQGDMERCLQAGMNAYVTKPINREQLFSTLHQWLPARQGNAELRATFHTNLGSDAPPPEIAGVDVAEALSALDIEFEVFGQMLQRFASDQPATIEKLAEAARDGNVKAVQHHAHSLAGAAGNLRANDLWSSARNIELLARSGAEIDPQLYEHVAVEARRVFAAINEALPSAEATAPASSANLPRLSAAELHSRLLHLRDALAEADVSGAAEHLVYLRGRAVPAPVASVLAEVRTSVDDYDLETAVPKVEALCVELEGAA